MLSKVSQADLGSATAPAARVVQLLQDDKASLKLGEVNKLLRVLWDRKVLLEQQDAETNLQLLLHFLRHSRYVIPVLLQIALSSLDANCFLYAYKPSITDTNLCHG